MRIQPGQASQRLGLDLVALARVLINGSEFASIGDENIMAQFFRQSTGPARMGADFHGDPAGWQGAEFTSEGSSGGRQAGFFAQFTFLVEDCKVSELVSKVQSNANCAMLRHGRFLLLAPVRALRMGTILPKMEPVGEGSAFSSQSRWSGPGMRREIHEMMVIGAPGKGCEGTSPGRSAGGR